MYAKVNDSTFTYLNYFFLNILLSFCDNFLNTCWVNTAILYKSMQ